MFAVCSRLALTRVYEVLSCCNPDKQAKTNLIGLHECVSLTCPNDSCQFLSAFSQLVLRNTPTSMADLHFNICYFIFIQQMDVWSHEVKQIKRGDKVLSSPSSHHFLSVCHFPASPIVSGLIPGFIFLFNMSLWSLRNATMSPMVRYPG